MTEHLWRRARFEVWWLGEQVATWRGRHFGPSRRDRREMAVLDLLDRASAVERRLSEILGIITGEVAAAQGPRLRLIRGGLDEDAG